MSIGLGEKKGKVAISLIGVRKMDEDMVLGFKEGFMLVMGGRELVVFEIVVLLF